MMRRQAFLTIGLLASILGLTSLVETAFANGCCCCCCCCCEPCPGGSASGCQTACKRPATICKDQVLSACADQNLTFSEVNMFPSSCVSTPGSNTKCDQPLRNCSRKTKCVINADGKCGTDPTKDNIWESDIEPTTNPC